jgi:hypothetical protein
MNNIEGLEGKLQSLISDYKSVENYYDEFFSSGQITVDDPTQLEFKEFQECEFKDFDYQSDGKYE